MSRLIKSKSIENKFIINSNITSRGVVGLISNTVNKDNQTIYRDKIGMTFYHLHAEVHQDFIKTDVASILGKVRSKFNVYKRSCEEITLDSIAIVRDLIAGDLYRGQEFLPKIEEFEELLIGYNEAENKDIYLWKTLDGPYRKIRNDVIGTLLIDVQTEELEVAVKKFESKTAPDNYKRTNAVVTPKMKEQHLKIIKDNGIEESLYKRYATLSDVSVNDVLFADSTVTDKMQDGIAGLMSKGVTTSLTLGKIRDTISMQEFIENIVPNSTNISVLVENKHSANLVSLIAPQYKDAPNIQSWNNNFSWAYNGGLTDSMKERVKSAGGKVDGILRFSIQWNEDKQDANNDLDAHCKEPEGGCHIDFSKKYCSRSGGTLDVDIQQPGNEIAVENITYQDIRTMLEGDYRFFVHNYSGRNTKGFRAEIEMDGKVHSFDYSKPVDSTVTVGTVTLKDGKFTLKSDLSSTESSKEIWNIKTQDLVKVDALMLSPNYWDGSGQVGNRHFFFMLEGCKNPTSIRGLYNEHLNTKYRDIRKSIDMLAPMLMCKQTDEQISGLGFSDTVRNEITVVVRGTNVSGTYKVKI